MGIWDKILDAISNPVETIKGIEKKIKDFPENIKKKSSEFASDVKDFANNAKDVLSGEFFKNNKPSYKNGKFSWEKTSYAKERELADKINSNNATDSEIRDYNIYRTIRKNKLPDISDINNNMGGYYQKWNSYTDGYHTRDEYNDYLAEGYEIIGKLNAYADYYSLYDNEGKEDFYELYNNFNNSVMTMQDIKKSMSMFADEDEYNGYRYVSNIDSYAYFINEWTELENQYINSQSEDEKNDALKKLAWLNSYGLNKKITQKMTADQWEAEKLRVKRANEIMSNFGEDNRYMQNANEWYNMFYSDDLDEKTAMMLVMANNTYAYADNFEDKSKPNKELLSKIYNNIDDGDISDFEKKYWAINWKKTGEIYGNVNINVRGNKGLPAATTATDSQIKTFMTDDEVKMFNYIYNTQGQEAAEIYLGAIEKNLNSRYIDYRQQKSYEFGKEHPYLAIGLNTLEAAGTAALSPLENLENFVVGASGEIDPYDLESISHYTHSARLRGGADAHDSKAGKIAYNALNVIAEEAAIASMSKGIGNIFGKYASADKALKIANKATSITNAMLHSSKILQDTTIQYKLEGASDFNALGMGVINALIEYGTEKWSMDRVLKSPDILTDARTVKKVAAWTGKFGGDFITGGSEELASNWLSSLAAFITNNREHDEFWSTYNKLKEDGKSGLDSFWGATKKTAPGWLEEFVIGGIAEGVFGTANTYSNVKSLNKTRQISADYFTENGVTIENVQKLIINNGVYDDAEIANVSKAISDMGQGKKVDADTEAKIKENSLYRGILYGYVDAFDSSHNSDMSTSAEVADSKATSGASSALDIISNSNPEFATTKEGRAGRQVYLGEVTEGEGGLVDSLMKDGFSKEDALTVTNQMYDFMYEQGYKGKDMDVAINAVSENIMPGYEKTAELFYTAGKIDAQNVMRGKKSARVVHNDVLKEMYKAGEINHKTVRAINAYARKTGFDIEFVEEIEGGHNASFNTKTGVLQISRNSKKPFISAAIHETVHAIRSVDTGSYKNLEDIVYDVLSANDDVYNKVWSETYNLYKEEAIDENGKVNRDFIDEELTAEVVSQLLTDEAFINEMAKADRNFVQRIYDTLVDFFDKMMGRYIDVEKVGSLEMDAAVKQLQSEFESIKKMYKKALANTEARRGVNMTLPKKGEVMHSDNVITAEDAKTIQSIGRKSINELTEDELAKLETIAQKYWNSMPEETRIKSPFFRRWFGDWREFDKSEVGVVTQKGNARGINKNKDTGWNIQISGKVFNETKVHNAQKNRAAVAYLDYINSIVENAVLLDTATIPADKSKSQNSMLMHSMYALADIGNGVELLKLYVEEFYDVNSDGTINRAYQLQDIIKAPAASVRVQSNSLSSLTNTASATYTVSDLFKLVKQYDSEFKPVKCSAVLNEDGTPKKVYHGTAERFSEFLPNKFGSNTGAPSAKKAIFFTDVKNVAIGYAMDARPEHINELYRKAELLENQAFYTGKYENAEKAWSEYEAAELEYNSTGEIMAGYVDIKNPLVYDFKGNDFRDKTFNDLINKAIKEKNDGVIFKNVYDGSNKTHDDLCTVYALFNPNQIKSVDNRGTFSSWNNDIYLSKNSIAKSGNKGYNGNTEQFRVMWTLEEGVLNDKEVASFYTKVSEMKKQRYHNYKMSKDGEYIFEIENKLVYFDGDYDYPEITKVVEFNTSDGNLLEFGRKCIYDGEEIGYKLADAIEISETLLGQGNVYTSDFQNSRAFEREIRGRKRQADTSINSRSGKDVKLSKSPVAETETVANVPTPTKRQSTSERSAASFELKAEVRRKLNEHIEKYGTLEKGVNPVRDVDLPKKTADDRYVRRGTRTVIESERVTDEIAEKLTEEIANGEFWTTYERSGGKKAQETARQRLEHEGFDELLSEWDSIVESDKKIDKQDMVNAQLLMEEAAKNGDTQTVVKIVTDIAAEATRAGQLVQSMMLLKKLGAGANVYKIEQTVKKLQKDLDKKFGKKSPTLEIPKDLMEEYAQVFESEDKAGDNDHSASDAIVDKIYEEIAKQIPAKWNDKLNTWRYFAMLGNPRTHIRNMSGNLAFQPVLFAKNLISATGEETTAAVLKMFGRQMQRTKTVKGVIKATFKQGAYKYALDDATKIESILRGEEKYGDSNKIMQKVAVYKSAFMNKLVNKNSDLLEKEDWIFLRRHYARALTMYMEANKLDGNTITDKQLEKARLYAIKEAQKATFRDASKLASTLSAISKQNKTLGFAVDATLPFKKTPINILKRGVEYSPVGMVGTIYKGISDVRKGKFTASEFIDGLGANLTGTGLLALGVYLASKGILRGPGDDEEDTKFSALLGMQNYSLKIGDGTYTIDWLSPSAMSLFVGCEMWNAMDDGKLTFADIADALPKITEPLFDMSMLDGLANIVETASYSQSSPEALASILFSIPTNYAGQFVPTLLGQVARTVDPVRRKTYIDKNSKIPQWLQSFAQQQAKKIPFLTKKLQPYVNAKGEEELNAEGNVFARAMQNFFSPGYYKSIESSAVDKEIMRLYESQGENAKNIIPKNMQKYITVDGERVNLSAEQYTTYQKTAGQMYYSKLKEVISSDYYKELSDSDKVKLLEDVREYSVEYAKEKTLPEYHSSKTKLKTFMELDGGYQFVLSESDDKTFEMDYVKGNYAEYEKAKTKTVDSILSELNLDTSDVNITSAYRDKIYEYSKEINLAKYSDGKYVSQKEWVNVISNFSDKEKAEFMYGEVIMSQADSSDEGKQAIYDSNKISGRVKMYVISTSTAEKYNSYLEKYDVDPVIWTQTRDRFDDISTIEVGGREITKKEQVISMINDLDVNDKQKSAIYRALGYKDVNSKGKVIVDVPWSYSFDTTKINYYTGRVGTRVADTSRYNNDADYGQCVWYARGRAYEALGKVIPSMGNANQMYGNAKESARLDATADNLKANVLVCYNRGTSSAGQTAGHVIYIESVNGDAVYYTEGGYGSKNGQLKVTSKSNIINGLNGHGGRIGYDIIGIIDVTKY